MIKRFILASSGLFICSHTVSCLSLYTLIIVLKAEKNKTSSGCSSEQPCWSSIFGIEGSNQGETHLDKGPAQEREKERTMKTP